MNALNERPGLFRAMYLLLFLTALPLAVWAAEWPASHELRDLQRRSSASLPNPGMFSGWQILWSPALDAPVMGIGTPVAVGTVNTPQALLERVTDATGTHADFEAIRETTVRGLTRDYFREMREKLPVLGGRADIVRNARGEISRWSLRAHDRWPVVDTHLLDANTAAGALSAMLPSAAWALERDCSFAAWFPDGERRALRPVYWVRVAGKHVHERWEGIVDAVSGEVLLNWPGVKSDNVSGTVTGPFWQPYIQSPVQTAPHSFESVWVNGEEEDTTDVDGAFTHMVGDSAQLYVPLAGSYVMVIVEGDTVRAIRRTEHAPYSPLNLAWAVGTDGATAAELNIYYHVLRIHGWYKSLDSTFSGMDAPIPAVANYSQIPDNAFWTGGALVFGRGANFRNFGMFSDIIYHEYTHGVTDGIYPENTLPYAGQSGALDEAFSDYFGGTINGDPYMGEYIGGSFNSWFRNLLEAHFFPDDWVGEVHDDSRFISESLWQIRTALGAELTDELAHFSRYALPDDFLGYFTAVIETDDDDGNLLNGTPHGLTIYNAFGDHGIGPGNDPEFAIRNRHAVADGSGGSTGDGDRYFEAGETIELTFDLANEAILYPPPASGIVVTVVPHSAALTAENGVITLTELAAGDSATLSPVLLHIAGDAADQWAAVVIGVTANDGAVTFTDTVEFMLGTPHLLIVEDDSTTTLEEFVTENLHTRNIIYDQAELSNSVALTDSLLPQPGVVIWLSGNARGAVLSATDQTLLAAYIAQGNRVVLSGQNIVDDLAGSAFLEDSLQVAVASDSLHVPLSIQTAGAPFQGDWYLLIGGSGAGNQTAVTSLQALGTSRVVAHYADSTGPVAAVECADGHALVLGFGIEAISGVGSSDPLTAMMTRIFAWADDVLSVTPRPGVPVFLPTVATLGAAYPNPFNSTTNLAYALPAVRGAELVVFDVLGRMVDQRRITAAKGTLHWGLDRASGVYFAQIRWNGGQTKPVKLLLVR